MRSHIIFPLVLAAAVIASPHAFAEETTTNTDTTATGTTVSAPVVAQSLSLKVRIDGNYKVIGTITATGLERVSLYEVRVKRPEKDDTVFTVDAGKEKFEDWNAGFGKNTYIITAMFEDGTSLASEPSVVFMGPNGEASTAATIESYRKARRTESTTSTSTQANSATGETTKPVASEETTSDKAVKHENREKRTSDKPKESTGSTTETAAPSKDAATTTDTPKSVLSAESRALIEAKFNAIPEEKREKFYMKLVVRIDIAIANRLARKQTKTVAILREIRAMVEDRLNAIEPADENSVINDILKD